MRHITRVSLAIAASATLAGALALPASAADTTATVQITAGSLAISAPAGASLSALTPGGSAAATLTGVQVIDTRAGTTNWAASVSLSDFVGVTPTNVIPAVNATYTPAAAVETGTSDVAATEVAGLSTTAAPVQSATGVVGNNTATWDASLSVTAPSNALADVYTATLTHSVL